MFNKITVNTHHAYLNTDILFRCDKTSVDMIDELTRRIYTVNNNLSIKLEAGIHTFSVINENQRFTIEIEDAIKLGGAKIKKAFVFDESPWVFMTTGDRLYCMNIETDFESVEYNISPDSISAFGKYNDKACEYFLFKTNNDYSIYNVLTGQFVHHFSNYIYGNNHLVIYHSDEKVIVYDYRLREEIVYFNDQYTLSNEFYFIKDNTLYGLNLNSSYIRTITQVGKVNDSSVLINNYLLKLAGEHNYYKRYELFSLDSDENNISKIEIRLPFYILSIYQKKTNEYIRSQEELKTFSIENKELIAQFPNIKHVCQGLEIDKIKYIWKNDNQKCLICGKITTFPDNYVSSKIYLEGSVGECINMNKIVHYEDDSEPIRDEKLEETDIQVSYSGILLGRSDSGNNIIFKKNNLIYLSSSKNNRNKQLFISTYDSSIYKDAYFTTDGNYVIFDNKDNETNILNLRTLVSDKFDIQGSTVSKLNDINGYKPTIDFEELDTRIPIWRDPITLQRVKREEISNYIFRSSDNQYSAETKFKSVYYNSITKIPITNSEYHELCNTFNWQSNTTDEEKRKIVNKRKDFIQTVGEIHFTSKIKSKYINIFKASKLDPIQQEKELKRCINSDLDYYINKSEIFTILFIDLNNYISYSSTKSKKEKSLYIGRNVWYLNYVSFSYDSKYLAFGAKMKKDEFRTSEEGVFEIFDLENEEVICRSDSTDNLYAVWMTMFSVKGDVAYYDSHPNTFIRTFASNYLDAHEIPGKSLLCFSPSGKYIALSDQRYIDYQHHSKEVRGHQPSGNIFIYESENTAQCLSHYNDFGEYIQSQLTKKRGNVICAAFSYDEKRLMAVSNDGVIVIRNLDFPDDYYEELPPRIGDETSPNVRTDERINYMDLIVWTYDGFKSDLFEYWCAVDEKWIDNCIYSVDGKILKRCPDILMLAIVVENRTETILKNAFENYYTPGEGVENVLETIYLPDSIKELDYDVFDNCFSLKEIYVPQKSIQRISLMIPKYTNIIKGYVEIPEDIIHNKKRSHLFL